MLESGTKVVLIVDCFEIYFKGLNSGIVSTLKTIAIMDRNIWV